MGAVSKRSLLGITLRYVFEQGNGVLLESQVSVRDDAYFLPRFGYRFSMPHGHERLRYFGRGPTESYEDKRHASKIGLYESSVTDHFEHYIRPQENMAHTDTVWIAVSDEAGEGIAALSTEDTSAFSFNCSHFSTEQLTAAAHDYELTALDETVVHIDYRQSGIGSNSCGPRLDDSLRMLDKEFAFSFHLLATDKNDTDPFVLHTRIRKRRK
jgi:beta-galactosidase